MCAHEKLQTDGGNVDFLPQDLRHVAKVVCSIVLPSRTAYSVLPDRSPGSVLRNSA